MNVCVVILLLSSFLDVSSQNYSEDAHGMLRNTDGANYLLAGPAALVASSSNRFCLSRLGAATRGQARLQLQAAAHNDTSLQLAGLRKNFPQGNGGCFDMVLPKTSHSMVTLSLRIRFDLLPDYEAVGVWRGVRVLTSSSLVAIQTDRPVYRTGDMVRFRILHLRPDLLPVVSPLRRVWIETSEGTRGGGGRVRQWQDVQTQLGLVQLQYQIDKYAPKGEWTIRVEAEDEGAVTTQSFLVEDYSLPTFYLTVHHSSRLVRSMDKIRWSVCARHMWGEGVRGSISVLVHSNGGNPPVKMSARLYGQPCHNLTLDVRRLGVRRDDDVTTVVADVAFQEESTRTWKNVSVISKYVEETIHVDFVNRNKMVVSPGLPYKIKIKVTNWDESPQSNTAVKVCREPENSSEEDSQDNDVKPNVANELCETLQTDDKGFVQAAFSVPDDLKAKFFKIRASVKASTATASLPVHAGEQARAALGALGAGGLRNHVPLYISYPPHEDIMAPTVHYMLVTRGGAVYRWGATTQCPQLPSTPLSTRQLAHPSTHCRTSSSTRTLLRMALPTRISHQMCPNSHLLVYFYHHGKLVFAAKHLKVSECFYNKVMAHWLPAVVRPGNPTRLFIRSLGPALCATSVKDVALAHLVSDDKTVSLQNNLMDGLKSFIDAKKNISMTYALKKRCFSENGVSDLAAESYEYLLSTFSTTGMRIMSDLLPQLDCPNNQPEHLEQPPQSSQHERSYFPESWLWDLHFLPSNGSLELDVKAPDAVTQYETSVACVSRSGVSIAPMAVLKVFQPFFVDLETPKRLKRGEQTEFFYKICNYINTSIAVTVDIETEPESGLSVYSAKRSAPSPHTVCVGVGDVYSVRLGVAGVEVGTWKITVIANVLPQMQQFCGSEGEHVFPSDKIVKEIQVVPEGEPMEVYHSSMVCLEENRRFPIDLVWKWEVPARTVPGTERWSIWVTGDISGPLDKNADNLLTQPLGCGEQNMARLAYNLIALRHMELAGSVSKESRDRAIDNIVSGYARQITYVHPGGGFSAFGPADEMPSAWLTAFCLRYMCAARQRLSMEGAGHVLTSAEDWLVSLQMENGCFENVGQVFHREFKGGLDAEFSNIAFTAYIVVSFIESETILRPTVVQSASYCLQALFRTPNPSKSNFALALVAYAQVRMEKYEDVIRQRNEINLKISKAVRVSDLTENYNVSQWGDDETVGRNRESRVYEENAQYSVAALRQRAKRRADLVWWETDSLATSIESTAYAILALLGAHQNKIKRYGRDRDNAELEDARGAVNWLGLHRNSKGGFLSTQDTLVALEAISAWSQIATQTEPSLFVRMTAPDLSRSVRVTQDSKRDLHTFSASLGTVSIRTEGKGCILVQGTQHYNSLEDGHKQDSDFSLHVSLKSEGTFDCQYNSSWCRCAAVLEVCVSWMGRSFPEMAILNIGLPTGYVTDRTLLYELLDKENTLLRRLEELKSEGRVLMYLATRGPNRAGRPGECHKLYLMGPKSKTTPANVFVYDYYHTHINASRRYTVPENCPGIIPHEEPAKLGSNNIYRSLEEPNDSEIEQSYMLTNSTNSCENISPDIAPPLYTQNKTAGVTSKLNSGINTHENPTKEINSQDFTPKLSQSVNGLNASEIQYSTTNFEDSTNLDKGQATNNTTNRHQVLSTQQNNPLESTTTLVNKRPEREQPNTENQLNESGFSLKHIERKNELNNVLNSAQILLDETEAVDLEEKGEFENFHVIDTDVDLDVPEGIEGPIPSVIKPPFGFVWVGAISTTEPEPITNVAVKPILKAQVMECEDRFANWTEVTYELENSENKRTQRNVPCGT